MEGKKFYWLRLKRDFFKRHDIQIIEAMPNGKDYILFYLKLLCESVDHDGSLRFSDSIPYNEQMLATITNTNVDVVKNAIKIFSELKMMDILDDGTLYMTEVNKMIGFETEWAQKKRDYRQRLLEDKERTKKDNVRQEIEKEIEKEIEIETEIKKDNTHTPETKHKYGEFGHVLLKDSEHKKLLDDLGTEMTKACIVYLDEYIEMKGYKAKNHYLCIKKWVIDAVNEKSRRSAGKASNNLEESYGMMAQWAEGET